MIDDTSAGANVTVYTKGSGAALPQMDAQTSAHVVSHVAHSDGIGGLLEADYTYEPHPHRRPCATACAACR